MDGAWQTTVAVQIKSLTGLLVFILTATILDCVCVCTYLEQSYANIFSFFQSKQKSECGRGKDLLPLALRPHAIILWFCT